jgi:hypothetical protein
LHSSGIIFATESFYPPEPIFYSANILGLFTIRIKPASMFLIGVKELMADLKALKSLAKERFGNISGVIGFGISDVSVRIYVDNEEVKKSLPNEIEGVPLDCIVTGEIRAYGEV